MVELIFAEQTQAFEYFEEMGLYVWQPTDETPIFALAEGQTYTVLWDGTPYSATAKEMSLDGITGIGLGNEGIVGIGEDNGQPFIFAYLSDIGTNGMNACYSTAEGDTHTIAIYKGVLTKGANIVTYDRNGQPVIHTGIETVSFNTDVEGEVATYYLHGGNTAEGVSKEVELNLADGDQTVEADPETLMSEVIIKKPVTLLPENIANGVNIAGVVGTLESGGSGGGDAVNVSGVTGSAGYFGLTAFIWDGATTKTQTPYTEIPEDAILNGGFFRIAYTKYASDLNTVTGTSDYVVCDSVNGIEETSLGNGRKRVSFSPMTFTGLSQHANKLTGTANVTYTMPNVSYENGILRCNADCKSLFGAATPIILLREIDMRGSQVKELYSNLNLIESTINVYCFKKIYFSEVFTKIPSSLLQNAKALEEIHFTSTTPPTAASGWYSNVPTTCKIYVPTGYLSTYTSASNYPDPATYTYIEE